MKSVAELTAFLKAKKGRVSFGYFSASMQALAEQYKHMIGIEASPAAYRNPAQMMNELEAGDYDFSFTSAEYALQAEPEAARAGDRVRDSARGCCPTCRPWSRPGLPRLPAAVSWFGMCMPAGVPDVAAKTSAPRDRDRQRDETRKFLKTFAGEPFPGHAQEFAKTMAQSSQDWAYFVKLAKITAQ